MFAFRHPVKLHTLFLPEWRIIIFQQSAWASSSGLSNFSMYRLQFYFSLSTLFVRIPN